MMRVVKYLSWRNWAVIEYNSMTENLFLFFYLALRYGHGGSGFLVDFFHFYLFSAVATSYGYLVNDLSDRKLDAVHGKANVFQGDGAIRSVMVVSVAFVLANLLGVGFFSRSGFLPLWVMWLFAGTFYSLPPLRFKEKGFWGLAVVVPAQRVIPALLALSVFGRLWAVDTIVLVLYAAVRGLMSDLQHQIDDFHLDSGTETSTFASRSGLKKSETIFRHLLTCNIILQVLLYLVACYYLPSVTIGHLSLPAMAPFLVVYVACLIAYGFSGGTRNGYYNPYVSGGLRHLVHVALPCFYFPFYLVVVHSFYSPSSLLLLAFFVVLHRVFLPAKIKGSIPARAILMLVERVRRVLKSGKKAEPV